MMQIKFNFNNFARVCHSLAACQRHTPSSLAAVAYPNSIDKSISMLFGLSNNDVIALRAQFRKFRKGLVTPGGRMQNARDAQ